MGSRRLITVLLVCLFVYNDIRNTQANVANHQQERHEYQYQRSSKNVGGTGYYNSRSGNVDQSAGNFDGWTQSQKDQVEGMAEKLRNELNTAQPAYGEKCTEICSILPGFVGRSQEEIDQIAKDMTSQIIADLQSGKIVRSQMNQPNFFEHQVAQKILELRNHHQEQYQQNVHIARNRFHENQGSHDTIYNRETENVQQQQQNVFGDEDLRQVQQSVFDQRQHQQQGSFFQQQSQNQQHTVYTRPVHRYYGSHTTNKDITNEQRFQTVYPTPMVVTNNVEKQNNFTSSSSTSSVPQINIYNQYGRTDKEREDREYTRTQSFPTVIPSYDRSYYDQKEYEEKHRNTYRPVTYPNSQTSQTSHTSQTTSETEHRIPVVIPTQRTTTTTNVQVEQEEKEIRRPPQLPPVHNYGREADTEEIEEIETIYHRPNIVPPTRTSYEVHNTERERKVVEVHTPSPVAVGSNKHSIYSHVEESEVVPNYQPRVVIDKNTEFEILDHRRDYRPHIPVTPEINYSEDHNEVEVNQVVQQVTPRYQPNTNKQHVITEETEETHTQFRPRPYPVYPNHGQTFERNQTSTSTSFRRPSFPIYPSFKTNATTLENGDTYIRYESHIPTSYTIELTVEEYEERLHILRNALNRLGYSRLTDEEYNATVAAGGFEHNGYKYIFNGNSGRFEKNTRVETNEEEYEVIFETLQQKLRDIGFGNMCEQEVQQAITTGVFIRNGNKFVYDAGREQYQQIRITKEERREIFTRIQELLRRLGYRLLTQKENEGVLTNGHFVRAAHEWIYNIVDGTIVKTIFVGDFAEFTDNEYREIYQKIQDTLRRIGYEQMSESQCNSTIASGTFERGGIYWSFNPNSGEFERIVLSQEEYRDRVQILRDELKLLRHQELTEDEFKTIIYQGYFYHGGNRYEYVRELRQYERVDAELTVQEYRERLRQLQEQLIRIGYDTMDETEYNSTITSGTFERGGIYWTYNSITRVYEIVRLNQEEYRDRVQILRDVLRRIGHKELSVEELRKIIYQGYFYYGGNRYQYARELRQYERIDVELTVQEYRERLRQLQEQLIRIGYGTMSEEEYNSTISSGTFERGGIYWTYNSITRVYEIVLLSQEEYRYRVQILRDELRRIGHEELSVEELRKIIYQGYFYHNGYRYEYIRAQERYERVELTAEEYRERLRQLQEQLIRIGYGTMTETEYNTTISSGTFERGGIYWTYNSITRVYEIVLLSQEEYRDRVQILRDELRRIGHKELSADELKKIIYQGYFYHGGYRYEYIREVNRYERVELSVEEYRERLLQLQEQIVRIGYSTMSEAECNSTISSGTFERGGIYWTYNSNSRVYEVVLLSHEEYQYRLQILRDELRRLGQRELSAEELRKIIYQGYFYYGGYRYEYIREVNRYEKVELTADEYRERLRQLKEQLIRIGYGTMSEAECNSTISSGKFYYIGYEWVYSFETRDYQRGNKITIKPTAASNHGRRPNHGIVSRNRGDQPPQHFEEDYESEEILEVEPGVGYYPIGKKPEIGLGTPEPMNQVRETTPIPTTIVDNNYQRNRYTHEQHLTTQIWPTQAATISERRYHRKQTTYTQTAGVQPQTIATQRSMRHVPGNEFGEADNELEESSTPFEPLVVSTQAYLVGNEQSKPYNPVERRRPHNRVDRPRPDNADDENDFIERYLQNERQPSPAVYGSNNNNQQQEEPKTENIEDLGQQFEDFDGQHEEDVQQQLIDLDTEAEDLRQQQVGVNGGQHKPLDNYAEESGRAEYNSHYQGQKEAAEEYEAKVVEVTDKADNANEESPGLWRRFKEKTKDIFGY